MGAVLGKTSLTQLVIMATFEVVLQNLNEYVGVHLLGVSFISFEFINIRAKYKAEYIIARFFVVNRLLMSVVQSLSMYLAHTSAWLLPKSCTPRKSKAQKRARATLLIYSQ